MPIYEYQCNKCNAAFDCVVMSISEKFEPKCEKCGSTDVKKLVSRVRYMSGPQEGGLASNVENRMIQSMGGKVDANTQKEIKELSRQAAKRGKKRYTSMMDTGKSENIDY
jgi:putative FmdB family regulatory protein